MITKGKVKFLNLKSRKVVGLFVLPLTLAAAGVVVARNSSQNIGRKVVESSFRNKSILTSKSQGLKLTNYKPLAVEACAPGDYEYEDYFGDGIWETYDECMENEGGDSSNSKEQEEDIYERVRKLEEEQKSQRITLDEHTQKFKEIEANIQKILDGFKNEIKKIDEEEETIAAHIREVTNRKKNVQNQRKIAQEMLDSIKKAKENL